MSEYTIRLKMPSYLAKWTVHEHGGKTPVELRRGSVERAIVETFIRKRPADPVPDDPASNVEIVIPCFKVLPPETYNYFPPNAKRALVSAIRNNFIVQMYTELYTLRNSCERIDLLVAAWMEKHGISYEPEDFEAIRQMFYRMRKQNNVKCRE